MIWILPILAFHCLFNAAAWWCWRWAKLFPEDQFNWRFIVGPIWYVYWKAKHVKEERVE